MTVDQRRKRETFNPVTIRQRERKKTKDAPQYNETAENVKE